jgi:LuxR family transcriptional regulator, maltose regulon positive regulatory protein
VTPPPSERTRRSSARSGLDVRLRQWRLAPPVRRPGCVPRAGLVNRLRVERDARVVMVNAPRGYGKTTLVGDWAQRDGRPFGWYTIGGSDDASDFLGYLTAAVGRACARGSNGFAPDATDVLASHVRGDDIVIELGRLTGASGPVVVVLDDVDRLGDAESRRLLSVFMDELPSTAQLVLITWGQLPLPSARLLARGDLVEIGMDDLRFTDREASAVLRRAGLDMNESDVEAVNADVEGWPAGLRFAALALNRVGTDERLHPGRGLMFDYFRHFVLSRLSEDDLRFLTRVSILDRLSGPLCDVVTASDGSAERLERLERMNLFVIPLDRSRRWYRLHSVFRAVLRAEFAVREPGLAARLLGRAAAWCGAYGDPALAFEYAHSAKDFEQLLGLLEEAKPFAAATLPSQVDRWMAAPDEDAALGRHPAAAVIGALTWAVSGRTDAADTWAEAARRGGPQEPWQLLLHSLTCSDGAGQMLLDALGAFETLPAGSPWRPVALAAAAAASAFQGELHEADTMFDEAAETAAALGVTAIESVALACQSLLASSRGEWTRADALAERAQTAVRDAHLEGHITSLAALAAGARSALRNGDWRSVHADLDRAIALLPRLTPAVGALAILARVEFARVLLALGNRDEVLRLLGEVDEVVLHRPELKVFDDAVHDVRDRLEARTREADGRVMALTAAELRLLPLLATHLSFREIAERLYVSRNTVKTQAISVYRKLGVSSRGDAVVRASGLGMVESDAAEG